jgi:hypothetical protein
VLRERPMTEQIVAGSLMIAAAVLRYYRKEIARKIF